MCGESSLRYLNSCISSCTLIKVAHFVGHILLHMYRACEFNTAQQCFHGRSKLREAFPRKAEMTIARTQHAVPINIQSHISAAAQRSNFCGIASSQS